MPAQFTVTGVITGTALVANHIARCWKRRHDDPYCAFARDNFNYLVAENSMKWRAWEFDRGSFNTTNTDHMFDWAENRGWGIRAHNLFWNVDDEVNFPDWVYPLEGKSMVEAIKHRIDTAMPHVQVK